MLKKTNRIIIIFILVILFIIIGIYTIYFYETEETSIELNVFKNMARKATCADETNELFLIDDQLVFWATEGNCSDASYVYILYNGTPNEILCKKYDSIAGPQEQYLDERYKEIFQIITDNLDSDDLGLGRNHKVIKIEI